METPPKRTNVTFCKYTRIVMTLKLGFPPLACGGCVTFRWHKVQTCTPKP